MHVSLMHHHRERFYYYHYQIPATINSNLINDQIVLERNSIRRDTFLFLFLPLIRFTNRSSANEYHIDVDNLSKFIQN